jgi:hypothetical protein
MAGGIGTEEIHELPAAHPNRAYRKSAIYVIGNHIIDLAEMLPTSPFP